MRIFAKKSNIYLRLKTCTTYFMKYVLPIVIFIFLVCCRSKNVDKQPPTENDCLISSYTTDTSSTGYDYQIKYSGAKIVAIRTTHFDSFLGASIHDSIAITYNTDGKPNTIGWPSSGSYTAKFFYDNFGILTSRITYAAMPFPTSKVSVEWKNNRISKITNSYYEIKGSPYAIENYTEVQNSVLDLEYDAGGNVTYVKRTSLPSMLVTEMTYEYDSHPNPFKDLFLLTGFGGYDLMYLLSANNMTRVKYFFVKEQYTVSYDSPYQYNVNGYPENGAFNNRKLNVQYLCK